jgi:hypothetical protein
MRSHDLGNDSMGRGISFSRIGEERRADLGQERDAHGQHLRHPCLGLTVLCATGLPWLLTPMSVLIADASQLVDLFAARAASVREALTPSCPLAVRA